MGATTQRIGTTPKQTEGLRTGVIDYLSGKSGANSPFGRITAAGPVAAQPWQGTALNRNMIRDVGVGDRSQIRDVTGQGTQSVDQLGGANSAFFQNMMGQLQPAFTQQRQLAAAQGSESAGNLTGSGFANRLGGALGRSLGQEQATLADYAFKGVGMEQARQAGDADRMLRGDMSNQGMDANFLEQGLRAQLANQGMDSSFINQILQGDQNSLTARGQDTTMRGQDIDLANANAQRYAGLLGDQAGMGVGPDEVIQKGGIGELLGPLGSILGNKAGGGQGGLGGILGQIFGGGGGGASPNIGKVIGIGPTGMPIFAPPTGSSGVASGMMGQAGQLPGILGKIFGQGGISGALGNAGIGAAAGGGGIAGALGGMAGGRLLGGALGSLIPIPGVGTALGSALGGWAAPKVAGAVKKAGGWLGDRLGFNDQKKKAPQVSAQQQQQQAQMQQMQQLAPLLQMLFGGGGMSPDQQYGISGAGSVPQMQPFNGGMMNYMGA